MHAHNASCRAVWVSLRRTMVELNMKVYIWLVKTLHNVLFSFALYLVLFLSSWLLLYIDSVAFSFSMSPTVGDIQYSTLQNTYIVEEQLHVTHEFLSVHASASSECKLTFLSVTDTSSYDKIVGCIFTRLRLVKYHTHSCINSRYCMLTRVIRYMYCTLIRSYTVPTSHRLFFAKNHGVSKLSWF